MIGDRWQDIVPAYHNVMTTFLVKTPENPWKLPNLYNGYVQPTYIVESAFEACRKITDLEYEAINEF